MKTLAKVLIGVLIVIVIVMIVGFVLVNIPTIRQAAERVQAPNFEVTSYNARSKLEGLDWVAYIDVTVYNRGGAGRATVWAEITQGDRTFAKPQSIYLDSRESRDLTFRFSEVSFWSGSYRYRVWVED